MRRIFTLTIIAVAILAMVGVGTWAYFSDTEQSTANTFTAGTLDLKLSDANETDQDGVSASFSSSNFKPGDSVGPSTITLKNVGTIAAHHVDIKFTNVVTNYSLAAQVATDTGDVDITDVSTQIEVTYLYYGTTNLLAQSGGYFINHDIDVADGNSDGRLMLSEINNAIIRNMTPPVVNSGATKALVITLFMDSSVTNGVQGDQVVVTITFGLFQDASQHLT
jgi:spore coat-associated protein N